MKKLILSAIIIVLILISSCSKDEAPASSNTSSASTCSNFSANLVGVWNIGSHEYDEGNGFINTGTTGTMTFLSSGTYTHSNFTYAWHCEPGANTADSGTWSYDSGTNKLTLNSTKPQSTTDQWGNTLNYSFSQIQPNILSCSSNELVFQFQGNQCTDQQIKITLVR